MGSILFRMILWDLFKVFMLSLITLTGILLMGTIVAEATKQGLAPGQILAAIPLLIPSTLPYTIPATTLFASCLVYGRMSSDHEILAIKASGGNLARVLLPGIFLGLSMSGVTAALYHELIPSTHHMLRSMVFNDMEGLLLSQLRANRSLTFPGMPYSMFVQGMQDKKLLSPIFKHRTAKGVVDVVAHAREADLRVDIANKQLLLNMRNGVAISEDGSRAYFVNRTFDVPLPNVDKNDYRRPRDMTWQEMLDRRRELREQLEHVIGETAVAAREAAAPGARPDLAQHVRNLEARQKPFKAQIQHIYVEMLMRPALSLGCLCFVLVACPVAVWFSRGDYLGSFITVFMPIVISYYPLVLCGTNMAKECRFNEIILVFGPNAMVAVAGLCLLRWLVRY